MGRERVLADRSDGTAFLQALESPAEAEDAWEQQWQQAVLRECMSEVSRLVAPATFKAFQLYVLDEWPVDKVAAELGITRNAVYIGKNRIMGRIRQMQTLVDEAW